MHLLNSTRDTQMHSNNTVCYVNGCSDYWLFALFADETVSKRYFDIEADAGYGGAYIDGGWTHCTMTDALAAIVTRNTKLITHEALDKFSGLSGDDFDDALCAWQNEYLFEDFDDEADGLH